jgi:hypothetical protein
MKRQYFIGLCLIIMMSLSGVCLAWDSEDHGAHWSITHNVCDFDVHDGLYLGAFITNHMDEIIEGDIDEDAGIRPLAHFNPKVTFLVIPGVSANDWVFDSDFSLNFTWGLFPYLLKNDYNWHSAMEASKLSKRVKSLGHVLHLFQDMCVPAHVRKDAHAPDLDFLYKSDDTKADPLEIEASKKETNDWPLGGYNGLESFFGFDNHLRNTDDFKDFFEKISKYVQENFYSTDTCFKEDLPGPKSVRSDDKYYYDASGRKIACKSFRLKLWNNDLTSRCSIDTTIAREQWEFLSAFVASVTATVLWDYASVNKLNRYVYAGKISICDDGDPVKGVKVIFTVNHHSYSDTTNSKGEFEITDINLNVMYFEDVDPNDVSVDVEYPPGFEFPCLSWYITDWLQ